jgi:hypothetical protein
MSRGKFLRSSRRKPGSTFQPSGARISGARLSPGRRFEWALMGLGVALLLAGCASSASSEQERRGGFYGSVSGGMSHP